MGNHLRHVPMPDRFFAQFEKGADDECWNWINHRTQSGTGYGQIRVDGKRWPSHRYSYAFFKGPIPEGFEVCHACDNPKCVNPSHLFTGTHKENMHDMHRKGRRVYARGHRKVACKRGHPFTAESVFYKSDGKRSCIICRRIRERNRS